MLPTDEERVKLQEFQHAADDVMLGSAEQFLSMLCSIPDLTARLRLWAFKLDYETTESVSVSLGGVAVAVLRRVQTTESVSTDTVVTLCHGWYSFLLTW